MHYIFVKNKNNILSLLISLNFNLYLLFLIFLNLHFLTNKFY